MMLKDKISDWLKEYLKNNNLDVFVIGVSGGIDSAVTSALCAQTGEKTIALTMPIHQNPDETNRGKQHIQWLKSNYKEVEELHIDLTDAYEKLKEAIPIKFQSDLSLANTRARIRMSTLYMIAGSCKGIVVGTGNKIEDFGVGFFTKYGDGGVDISPIADLMKSEVYDLGKEIGVIEQIMTAKPTDGLWDDGRTDEDQLGVSYDDLEWAMNCNLDKTSLNQVQNNILNIYEKHRKSNIHKMKKIPVFKK
mgnify:CR=1 FL=1